MFCSFQLRGMSKYNIIMPYNCIRYSLFSDSMCVTTTGLRLIDLVITSLRIITRGPFVGLIVKSLDQIYHQYEAIEKWNLLQEFCRYSLLTTSTFI